MSSSVYEINLRLLYEKWETKKKDSFDKMQLWQATQVVNTEL